MKSRTLQISFIVSALALVVSSASAVSISTTSQQSVQNFSGVRYTEVQPSYTENLYLDIPEFSGSKDAHVVIRDNGQDYPVVANKSYKDGGMTFKNLDTGSFLIGVHADNLTGVVSQYEPVQHFPRFNIGKTYGYDASRSGGFENRIMTQKSTDWGQGYTDSFAYDNDVIIDVFKINPKKSIDLNSVNLKLTGSTPNNVSIEIVRNSDGQVVRSNTFEHQANGRVNFDIQDLSLDSSESYTVRANPRSTIHFAGQASEEVTPSNTDVKITDAPDRHKIAGGISYDVKNVQNEIIGFTALSLFEETEAKDIIRKTVQEAITLFDSTENGTQVVDAVGSRTGMELVNGTLRSTDKNFTADLRDMNYRTLRYVDLNVSYNTSTVENPAHVVLSQNNMSYSMDLNDGLTSLSAGSFGVDSINKSADFEIVREVSENATTSQMTLESVSAVGTITEPVFGIGGVFEGSGNPIQMALDRPVITLSAILVLLVALVA